MRGCPVAISSKTWSHGEVFEEKIDALHDKKITVNRNDYIIFLGAYLSGDGESAL
jgi:hypothetical protein